MGFVRLGRDCGWLLGLWLEAAGIDPVSGWFRDDGGLLHVQRIMDVARKYCDHVRRLVVDATGLLIGFKMKIIKAFFTLLYLSLLMPVSGVSEPPILPSAQQISAADPRFHYEGRFDFSDSNAPVVIWQASRISLDFAGDTLGLLFDNAKGQSFFNAQVDGSNTVIEIREGTPPNPATLSGLGRGRHQLVLFKRSEANSGTVSFRGVVLAAQAQAWAPAPTAYKLALEFIGDSITVGACDEDGDTDQWENRRTHNSALSFATLTAAAFDADGRNIAVSGMGIATGWVPMKAGEIWDRLYPDTNSPIADLSKWTPRIVFVNFGENDASFPNAHAQPFPTNYTAGYVSLVQAIRQAYPAAQIVLLRGGMYNGAQSKPLRKAWESAVAQLETKDKAISHFVFLHWTKNHPRVADHRAMADELIAWLKQQDFMRPGR
jgi:lysophospholipase L1-like esterase